MIINPWDRRTAYDLDYFENGDVERRRGLWERRSGKDRRRSADSEYDGLKKHIDKDRRCGEERRKSLAIGAVSSE